MGSVISKARPAASTASAAPASAGEDADTNAAAQPNGSKTVQNASVSAVQVASEDGISRQKTSVDIATTELPADMQFILESGLHIEPESEKSASANNRQNSIQDAVNDIKAKYNMNQPVASGELERIRKEIELKTRLMEMREAAQQKRMAAVAAASKTTSPVKEEDQATPVFKVDVKGKGRADAADDSSSDSDDDDNSSSDDDSDSGSSSSGSSLNLKQPKQKGKQAEGAGDSDEDGSDDDSFVVGKLKPEEIAQAAAAFASQHEVLEPVIPPPPVDTIPTDAPLRPIGRIDHIINSVIVIRADMNTQEGMQGQILDEGSLLCLGDRRVLGAIFETFGSVNAPYYSIRLPPGHQLVVKTATADGAESEPVQSGMQVFYSPTPDFSGLLYTREIRQKQMKGSDASNLYDEEPGENEIEFSDDEQEVAYKRDLKQRKKDRWVEKQGGMAEDNAEFEFDEDFDDGASVRSVANRSHEATAAQDSEEEGAIAEPATSHKRRLSSSTASTHGGDSKAARVDNPQGNPRGRGGRPERGRGRGRGASASQGQQPRGRGGARGGMERGRGRGQSRGSSRGGSSSYAGPSSFSRPPVTNGLPPRPSYQHPDALPYDDVQTHAPRPPRSVSPVRPQHALPQRPVASVEQYDPSIPQSQSLPAPPRGMNAFAQPWSPASGMQAQPSNVPYVPSTPFFPQAFQQQYNPMAFGSAPGYGPGFSPYQQAGNQGQQTTYPYSNGYSGSGQDQSGNSR